MNKIFLLLCILIINIYLPGQVKNTNQVNNAITENNGYNVNNICGVDEFGRTFSSLSGTKENKSVGMFYFIWMGQHADMMTGIYDNTKILAADSGNGMLNLFNKEGTAISPLNKFNYWGEPLYQYYNSGDDYVIRKHIEMLTVAGIDYLVFDVTNASTYNSVWRKLMEILNEYQMQGWNVPKIAFYTNSYSENTMVHLYNVLYSRNYYPDLWYKPDGKKPLIIGKFDNEPAAGMEQTIREFFYFRSSQWPDERVHSQGHDTTVFHPDGFPWIDWQKPQRLYNDIINVSVAQHPQLPFSDSYLLGSKNWGRGFEISNRLNDSVPSTGSSNYRYIPGANNPSKIRTGANFEQEWKLALKADPPNIFVTGWNQWIAIKQIIEAGSANERICFVDSYNEEYSWDIEPMKGGYNDAFFIQLIQNVRKFKGISGNPSVPVEKAIDIDGDLSQWDDITNVYRNIGSKNYGRNYAAFAVTKYTMDAPENNLQEIKVTNDADNIYFLIKAENNITGNSEGISNWMNLFIGTGEVKRQGWEGYNFAINRMRSADGRASIEILDSTATGVETLEEAEFVVNGNTIQFKIPKSALALPDSAFQLYFKIADGIVSPTDIMDYYVTGKSLPMGRLSYIYNNSSLTSIDETIEQLPGKFNLEQNYPNPFNPVTEIKYSLPVQSKVTLKIFNLLGQEVRSLVNTEQAAGIHTVKFDAAGLASGTYMYRIDSGNYSETKKMILLK